MQGGKVRIFDYQVLMSSESDLKAIENFRNYLRIKTVHPNPDYDGCVKFLIGMAEELGLKHEIIEVKPQKKLIIIYKF